jgi:hypothetical protein
MATNKTANIATSNGPWIDLLARPLADDGKLSPKSDATVALEEQLGEAMSSGDTARIVTLVAWLIEAGRSVEEVASSIAIWCGARAHAAMPAAIGALADGLRACASFEDLRVAVPLAQAATITAELLQGGSELTNGALATESAAADWAADLGASIEEGDGEGARSCVERLSSTEVGAAQVERNLLAALYRHADRVAHLAPLLARVCELRACCGDRVALPMLAVCAERLANTVGRPISEDIELHRGRFASIEDNLSAIYGAQDASRSGVFNESKFRKHLLDGTPEQAFRSMGKALAYGIERDLLAQSLSLAAADRVLRFDPSIARQSNRQESWDDVAHLLVLTSAVRQLRLRLDTPDWLRLVLQATHLVNRFSVLDAPERDRFVVPEPEAIAQTWDHGPQIAKITARILAGDTAAAMAMLRGYLLMVLPEQPLCSQIAEVSVNDVSSQPQTQAHMMAVVGASIEEFNALSEHPHRERLLCAAIRYMTGPDRGRRVHALALTCIDTLETGRRPDSHVPLPWITR